MYVLPKRMATKVSDAVVDELSGNFSELNNKVSASIAKELGTEALSEFLSNIVQDISMRDILAKIQGGSN